MCCHQCSTFPPSSTVAERESLPANTTLLSTWGTPLVQINYLGGNQLNASSVSINGAQYVGANQHSSINLHRASTVSAALTYRGEATHIKKMEEHAATTCCSAGLYRAHSIHICIKTGSDHHKQCPRSHLPSKIGDSIRKKLSFITKLRKKSGSPATHADDLGAVPRWLNRTTFTPPSSSGTEFVCHMNAEDNSATSETSPAELYGECYFRPIAKAASTASFAGQAGAKVDATHLGELSDNVPAVAELRECQTLRRVVDAPVDQPKPRPIPATQTSIVSAMPSSWQGSTSDYYTSRQDSQYSAVSDFTPNTSISLPDGTYSYASSSKLGEHPSLPQPPLTLETHLQVPPTTIMGGPLTDSPTDDEGHMPGKFIAPDNQRFMDLLTTEDQGSSAFVRTSTTPGSISLDYYGEDVRKTNLFVGPSISNKDDDMEEVRHELDAGYSDLPDHGYPINPGLEDIPPPFSIGDLFSPIQEDPPLPASLMISSDNSRHNSDFEPMPSSSMEDCRGDVARRLIDACQQYALSWSLHPQDTLTTYLQDTFDVTLSYYLTYIDHPNRLTSMSSDKAWGVTPTIDAALIAVHRILTSEGVPTPYQLVSLAFFSLSLLCLSLENHDLHQAVKTLHLHARSWSSMIEHARERQLFEELVDNLWLLPEEDSLCTQVRERAPGPACVVGTTAPMWWDRDNFIIEVASIFISLAVKAGRQPSGLDLELATDEVEPPPSFEEAMKEEQDKLFIALCGGESYPDPRAFHNILEQAQLMGLLTTFGSLESFTRCEPAVSDGGMANLNNPLMDFLAKILGGRHIGRAALWLKEQLQSIASRVVSHPQGLTLTSTDPPPAQHAPDPELEAVTTHLKGRVRSQREKASPGNKAKRVPKSSTSKKRKVNSGAMPEGPFRCETHNITFTGEWALDSYNRHLTRTKSHGCQPFKCPECGAVKARIEHFKTHMKKYHKKMVRGRSGEYSFVDIVEGGVLGDGDGVVDGLPGYGGVDAILGRESGGRMTNGHARGRRGT